MYLILKMIELAISDYIMFKCESTLGKQKIIKSAKLEKKMEDERAKYPNYEWVFSNRFIEGGLANCDNPNNEIDARGWRPCYFGHPTKIHWVVNGYVDKKLMKTFTFGKDCVKGFNGMSE